MCDYSLHCIKTRLADEGEQLFVHKFYTGSKGLASVDDLKVLERPQPAPPGTSLWGKFRHWLDSQKRLMNYDVKRSLPAVCIPPGARLQLNGIPTRLQIQYGVSAGEEVTFVQLSAEPFRYRDAIRFRNGQEVLLQNLNEGLQVNVLSLTLAEDEPEPMIYATTASRREEWSPV
jgi:hypothetical protein